MTLCRFSFIDTAYSKYLKMSIKSSIVLQSGQYPLEHWHEDQSAAQSLIMQS